MALDFFGTQVRARIIQYPEGAGGREKIIELWTEPTESNRFAFDALSFVSQINMELMLGDNAKLSVVLTPPFEDGLRFLQSDLVRFGAGRLEVEIGYTTGTTDTGASQFMTLPFFGLLQKPDVSIGQDITITLHALGVGYAMNTVGGSKPRTFPADASPAECIEQVLKGYVDGKYTALDISDLYKAVTPDQRSNDPFFKPLPEGSEDKHETTKSGAPKRAIRLEQGPRNDWWFIRETIENYGYDLFIQGNKVYIAKKTDWLNRDFGDQAGPRKHFKLKGNVDPSVNMYPILTFQSPTEAVWMENGIGRQSAADIDSQKGGSSEGEGGVIEKVADVYNTAVTWLKERSGLDPEAVTYNATAPSEASSNVPVDPSSPAGREKLASEWRKKNMEGGIQGEFQTIGCPGLRPGEVVQVSGFEVRGQPDSDKFLFNGPYGVINVRHSIGVGGFMTNFLGVMNFYPKAFKEAARQGKGDDVKSEPTPESKSGGSQGDRVTKESA